MVSVGTQLEEGGVLTVDDQETGSLQLVYEVPKSQFSYVTQGDTVKIAIPLSDDEGVWLLSHLKEREEGL